MKPEANALNILSTTRATAKMYEFRVPREHFIKLPRDPAILFSLAIGILGDVAASIADELGDGADFQRVASLPVPFNWDEENPSPLEGLRFASTFFDAFLNAQLDDTITPEFSLLCASAYYLSGSVGSAAVVVRQMQPPPSTVAGGLGLLVYAILSDRYEEIGAEHSRAEWTAGVLDALGRFFRYEGDAGDVEALCNEMRAYFYGIGEPRELLYSDLFCAICAHKLRNAARTILPAASGLDAGLWRPALAKSHFPIELWPAQQRIADAGLLAGNSAVIQMPTSAGKTRATELIIRASFLSKRASLAVIVAPYRSLCHDIRSDLSAAFADEPIRLDEASDAYQFDLALEALLAQESVLIVTPEKLLYMLRRAPNLAEGIGLIIYDEGHQFDGITRGPTYELLLTSLRIALPEETQVILISAVIGNARDIAAWLIDDPNAVVGGDGLLPTAKSIAFASWQDLRGRLEYVAPLDPDEGEFYVPRIIAAEDIPRRKGERKQKHFPEKDGGDIGLFLGLHVVRNGSVAVFCGRKDSVTKICKRAVDLVDRGVEFDLPLTVSNADEVEKIRFLSEAELGAKAIATQASALGIFAHHADTPHGIRLAIEHAMKEDLAKFVICTSTLAQGVNFPLRYLIVTTTHQGGEKILVRDFHNLMGRAGRAGMHTEGSVIFSTPTIYDQREQFSGKWRWDGVTELLNPANSEPSQSAILALFDAYEQRKQRDTPPIVQEIPPEWLDLAFADADRIEQVVAAALGIQPNISAREFRQFIEGRAHVVQSIATFLVDNMAFSEGEDIAARTAELAGNTLAYHLADEETKLRLVEVFRAIGRSIAANTSGDQRALIRRSPLPPAAVGRLQAWLAANVVPLVQAATEGRLLETIGPTVLEFSTTRPIRTLSDQTIVPRALGEWVAGRSFAVILATLEESDVRIGGNRKRPTIEDAVALCESGFGYEVAMVVASLADLAEEVDADLHATVTLLQKQIKYGLADQAAIAFHEAGFADRFVASRLANAWPAVADRAGVRAVCRNEADAMRVLLADLPSYFKEVADEFGV